MRTGHAPNLLRQAGYIVKASQMGGNHSSRCASTGRTIQNICKNEMNGLSLSETIPWWQLLGIKQRNKTLEERKQDLHPHFEGKSESYVLRM